MSEFMETSVSLGQYKGLGVKTGEIRVYESEIDDILQMAIEEATQTTYTSNRPVEEGDTILLDFEGFMDGIAFPGGKGQDYELTIGSHSFIDGFEDQLAGVEVGKEVRVNVSFPENYGSADLAGRPAIFVCMVKGIQEKLVPQLDDEFVQNKYHCRNVEECRDQLRVMIQSQKEEQMKQNRTQALVLRAVSNAEAVLPEKAVQEIVDEQFRMLRQNLENQGITLEIYMEQYSRMLGSTAEQLMHQTEEHFRQQARDRVKTDIVLQAISEVENLTLSEEELDSYLNQMAENYNMDPKSMRENLDEMTLERIRTDLRNNKAIRLIVDSAVEE